MTSKLEKTVQEAVAVQREIDSLPNNPKLSAQAFLAQAMAQAGTTKRKLDALEGRLSDPAYSLAAAFIKRLERDVCLSENYGSPPTNGSKLVRAYGRESTMAELNGIGAAPLDCLALASRWAVARRPERFGTLEDLNEHFENVEDLYRKRDSLLHKMQSVMVGSDLLIDQENIAPSERAKGLTRTRFKNWPSVLFGPDWPEHVLVAAMAEQPEKEDSEAA